MSKTIDERVVEMRFDNKQFESGISSSISWLDKLKQSLKLDSASKGLDEIGKKANNLSFSGLANNVDFIASKFSTLGIVGVTALQNIANRAIDTGATLVKSLTIDPVMTGLEEYETKMNAITTILTNTKSKGTTLDDVNKALNQLNEYADLTIYNFAEMTRNIGTFTAAGVDLETSVKAIKGIANLGAGSGSTAAQVNSAMYQLSQALAAGRVSLQDWNSVVNAGMGGEMFQNALKETAKQMGIIVDESVSFRESISAAGGNESWLTSDVLVKTLEKFADNKDLIKAATEVKTVTQLIDTMKESVQSGWAQSWEYIIGDRDQATKTLTAVKDAFDSIIQPSADARNEMLKFWNQNGGRDATINAIANAFNFLRDAISPIKTAFDDVFPPLTGQKLVDISKKVEDLTSKFKISGTTAKNIENTFKGVFSIFSIGGKAITALVGGFGKLLGYTLPIGSSFLSVTGAVGSFVTKIDEVVDSTDIFSFAIDNTVSILGKLLLGIGSVSKGFVSFIGDLSEDFDFPLIETLEKGILAFEDFLKKGKASFKSFGEEAETNIDKASDALEKFLEFVKAIGSSVKAIGGNIIDALGPIGSEIKKVFEGVTFTDIVGTGMLGAIALMIRKFVKSFGETKSDLQDIVEGLSDVLDAGRESLEAWQHSIQANTLVKIAAAVAILTASLIALTFVDGAKLKDGLIGVTVLLSEVIVILGILSTYNFKGVAGAAASLVILSVAISTLAGALLKLKDFQSWDETWPALVSMIGLIGGLTVSAKALSTISNPVDLIKAATGILIFSFAVTKMGEAMKSFSKLNTGDIVKSLTAMGVLLAEIAIFVRVSDFSSLTGAKTTILQVSSSMLILYLAVSKFGSMDVKTLLQGMSTVGLLMTGLAASIALINVSGAQKISAGVLSVALALNSLLIPIAILGNMNADKLKQGVTGVISLLTALSVAIGALSVVQSKFGMVQGISLTLIALSTALNMLVIPITVLGALPWQVLAAGIGSLIVVLAALGATATVLAPFGTSLIAVAGAFALFGAAIAGIGVGLGVLTTGLVSLAAAGVAGAAGLTAMLTAAIATIPLFMAGVAKGIVAFAEVIITSAPVLGEAFTTMILTALQSIRDTVPAIVETVLVLIDAAIDAVYKYGPKFANAFFDFFIGVLDILETRMPELVVKAANLLKVFVNSIFELFGAYKPENLLGVVASISALVACFALLAASATLAKKAIIGTAAMALVMVGLAGIFVALSSLPIDDVESISTSLSAVLLSLSASMVILSMIPIPAALAAIASLAIAVAGITAILSALGGLSKIDGFEWLLKDGASILGIIGSAIGGFVGNIAGAFIGGVSSSFPIIAENLSLFMENIQPFIDGVSNIDTSATNGVKALAETILIMTAADLLNGITSIFGAGTSLTEFGKELSSFAPYFKQFYNSIKDVDGSVVESSANAAKALAEFATNIPNTGGLAAKFAGENSISAFADELVKFGPKLKQYAASVAGLDADVVINSANAGKAVAELANTLPNSGGALGFFAGENDMGYFGEQLIQFGRYLKSYAMSVTGLDADVVVNSANAAKAVSELANNLPNSGGVLAFFTGDNDMRTFGEQLSAFGHALQQYAQNVANVNPETITASVEAVRKIVNLAQEMEGVDAWAFSEFDQALSTIAGTGIQAFANAFSADVSGAVEAASALGTKTIAALRASVNSQTESVRSDGVKLMTTLTMSMVSQINVQKSIVMTTFKALLTAMITTGLSYLSTTSAQFYASASALMNSFANGIRNNSVTVVSTINGIGYQGVSAIRGQYAAFYSAGGYVVSGLAAGIRNNGSSAISAAANVAARAYQAAKSALDVQSPSHKFEYLGEMSDKGLGNGLLRFASYVTNAGKQVSTQALSVVKEGIYNAVNSLNGDSTFRPTITPVMDLSNVRSGANQIGSLFQNGMPTLSFSEQEMISRSLGDISKAFGSRFEGPIVAKVDNSDVINELQNLGRYTQELKTVLTNLQVVMDTGATVGQLEYAMDKRLGMLSSLKGRGI